jgi:hypothetical protein
MWKLQLLLVEQFGCQEDGQYVCPVLIPSGTGRQLADGGVARVSVRATSGAFRLQDQRSNSIEPPSPLSDSGGSGVVLSRCSRIDRGSPPEPMDTSPNPAAA